MKQNEFIDLFIVLSGVVLVLGVSTNDKIQLLLLTDRPIYDRMNASRSLISPSLDRTRVSTS